jgi:hypothetical protein
MTSYKLPVQSPNQRPFRILGWGAIILLLGILFFSLYDPPELSDSIRRTVGWAALTVVMISIAIAALLSSREGLWKPKRTFQFQLSDDKLLQLREGSPTTEMPLTRIESIQEYRNWLIVRGGEPTQQIAIPVEVEAFQELKRKLATYGTASPLKTKSSPLWLLQLAVATVAYVLLLTSHVVSVVIVAGCLALLLQGLGFYSLRRAYRGRLMKLLLTGTYLFSCLIIVWLAYERTRGIT